jgi:hypothetical protein
MKKLYLVTHTVYDRGEGNRVITHVVMSEVDLADVDADILNYFLEGDDDAEFYVDSDNESFEVEEVEPEYFSVGLYQKLLKERKKAREEK